ncbi:MAG: antibiotic biosynthesis monooxygenase [Acidobacteria bacterium]|nr:antibiotic biosynthesis monooxygenase [Acidobacteriota bacterium]
MKFAVMVVFKVLEDKIAEFSEALIWHSENTWTETGSIKFVIYVDEVDPSVFYLYELYENRGEFEKHTKTDYIATFGTKARLLLREPSQIFRGVPLVPHPKSEKGQI